MIDQFIFQYPLWYLWLCFAIGISIAGILYYRDRRFKEQHKYIPVFLFLMRFFCVSAIVLLLLNPLIRDVTEFIQPPIVVIAKDISESATYGMDEAEVSQFNLDLKNVSSELSDKFEVKEISFGGDVLPGLQDSFTEKVTNISSVLQYITDNYSDQNLGAVILSSDGIFNEGSHPLYSTGRISAPLYALAMGDTSKRTDLTISNIFANNLVYLGDKFVLQVDIQAFRSAGQRSKVRIFKVSNQSRNLLFERDIVIDKDDYFTTEEFILEATEAGVTRYQVTVTPLTGEISRQNNTRDKFIQVFDARQKVLLLGHSPHPDLAALGQMINKNKNYTAEVLIYGDQVKIEEFDQVIFHNLPGQNKDISTYVNRLKEIKTPHAFIVGSQTSIPSLNRIQDIVNFQMQSNYMEDVNANYVPEFRRFTISDRLRSSIRNFPPLSSPFGEYIPGPNTSVLLKQKIKSVDTDYPLLLFQEKDGLRVGMLAGEGLWRWRLYDFLQNSNDDNVSEIVNKTIQYISVKKDSRKFIVQPSKNLFRENERILFTSQLYNDNYELINEPEVSIVVTGANNEEYKFIFTRVSDYYTLDAGLLSPGTYRYHGKTVFNGQELEDRGTFLVQDIQLELYDLEARHHILQAISDQTGGKIIPLGDLSILKEELLNKTSIKPAYYENVSTSPLIYKKWLFFSLLLLLSTEWFVRRYMGSY